MDKRDLRKYLAEKYGRLEAPAPLMSFGSPLVTVYDVIADVDESDKDNPQQIMLTDILDGIGSGGSGGSGGNADYAESIKTIDGSIIEFFVGEEADYKELPDDDKEDLFAIITDDPTQKEVIDGIEELMEWKNQSKNYVRKFGDVQELKKGSDFEIGTLPKNRGLDGIVGIGLEIIYEPQNGSTTYMHFSGNKTNRSTSFPNPYTGRYEVRFCATAGTTNDSGECGTASMNIVVGSRNDTLYFYFENGSYLWMNDIDGANPIKQGVRRLNDGGFYLSSVAYWFE